MTPREIDENEACDFVIGVLLHLIDVAPNKLLILDRESLRVDGHRKIFIEITNNGLVMFLSDTARPQ